MAEATRGQFTGWHMLTFVLLFFGTIIGVNIFMAYSAISSWTGLVVQNSYVASQQFNDRLTASRAQAALNWQTDLTYTDGTLRFSFSEEDGTPFLTDKVVVELTRPVGITQDLLLELIPEGVGYALAHAMPSGIWNVTISADVPGFPPYEQRARLLIEP